MAFAFAFLRRAVLFFILIGQTFALQHRPRKKHPSNRLSSHNKKKAPWNTPPPAAGRAAAVVGRSIYVLGGCDPKLPEEHISTCEILDVFRLDTRKGALGKKYFSPDVDPDEPGLAPDDADYAAAQLEDDDSDKVSFDGRSHSSSDWVEWARIRTVEESVQWVPGEQVPRGRTGHMAVGFTGGRLWEGGEVYDVNARMVEGGDVVMFGGESKEGGILDDMWMLNVDEYTNALSWKKVQLCNKGKPKISRGAVATDGNIIVLFGGFDGTDIRSDTWRLDMRGRADLFQGTQLVEIGVQIV